MSSIESGTPPRKKPRQNSAFLRLMSVHWWMARLDVVLFVGGWLMTHLPKDSNYRTMLYDFHKSIRCVDNSSANMADFSTIASMVAEIYKAVAKVYAKLDKDGNLA